MLITKLKLHAPGVGIEHVLELCDDDLDHLEHMYDVREYRSEGFDENGKRDPEFRPRPIFKFDTRRDYEDRHPNDDILRADDIGPSDDDWLSVILGANRSGKTLRFKLVDCMFAAMDRLVEISLMWNEDLPISRTTRTSLKEASKGNFGANDVTTNQHGIFPIQDIEEEEDSDFFNRIFEDFHWLKGLDESMKAETAEAPYPHITPRDFSISLETLEGVMWRKTGFSEGSLTPAFSARYKMEGVTKVVRFNDPHRPEDQYAALEAGSGLWRLQALTLTQKYDPEIIYEGWVENNGGFIDLSWEVLKLSDPFNLHDLEGFMVYPSRLWHVIEPSFVRMAERWCDVRYDHEGADNQKIWREVAAEAYDDANMRAVAYLAEAGGWGWYNQAEKWWNETHSERTGRDIRTFDPRGEEYWKELEARESWGDHGGYAVIPYGMAGLERIGGEWGMGLFQKDVTCSYLASDRAGEDLLDKLLQRRRAYWRDFQRDLTGEFIKKYHSSSGFFRAGDTVLNVLGSLHESRVSDLEEKSVEMVRRARPPWEDFWSERWEGVCTKDELWGIMTENYEAIVDFQGVGGGWKPTPSDNPLLWHYVNTSFLAPTCSLLYAVQRTEPADFEAFAIAIQDLKDDHEGAAVREIMSTFEAFAKRPEWYETGIVFQIFVVIEELLTGLMDWLSGYSKNTPSPPLQSLIDEYAPEFAKDEKDFYVPDPYDYLVNGLDYRIHCERDEWTLDNAGPHGPLSHPAWDSFKAEAVDELGGKVPNFPGGFEGPSLESRFVGLTSGQRHLFEIVFHFALGKVDLVLIDEPEISLHVALQDKLVECLKTESRGGPAIVLATHSPTISGAAIARTFNIDPSFESDVAR